MSQRTKSVPKAGALVLAVALALGACSTAGGAADGSSADTTTVETATAADSSSVNAAATSAEADSTSSDTDSSDSASTAASVDSTELEAGSYTATISGTPVSYQAAYLVDGIDAVIDGGTYESTTGDEVVFLVVNGGSLTITNATVAKTGDAASESDDYNFYGMNSAIVVVGEGSSASIDGTTITTDSDGSNAVMAVDSGEVSVTNTTITTTGDSSRGLHATTGGVITGADLTIDTAGAHCAAVATDRGGGTVTVTGTNSFHTAGDGSPLVYSTGDITVSGVTGTSEISEVVVVEGKNTATIIDSDVTASGDHALMIYQSMSGDAADADAATSVGAVTIENSTITFTQTEAVFYFTNTTAELTLDNVTVDTSSTLLASAQEDRWGNSGNNGADVSITISGSTFTGDIEAGDSSSIAVTTTDGGSVTGSTGASVTITEG
jgi:hypothetical protein